MKKLQNTRGFTIIELLIATVVFSVVLLIITTAIIQMSRIYYKGVITSRTQQTARSVMNEVSQNIQFGSGSVVNPNISTASPATPGQFSVGNQCFKYTPNTLVTNTVHGLQVAQGSCVAPGAFTELLGSNMQLTELTVSQPDAVNQPRVYEVNVGVVYGQSNDMEDWDSDGNVATPPVKRCKAIILGGQFCAVTHLKTIVAKRID